MKKRIIDARKKEKFMIDDEYLNGMARLVGHRGTLVYFSLCRHANNEQKCFPSIKLMAEEHAVGRETIKRGIKSLLNRKVINVTRIRTKNGKWLNNSYTLLDKSEWDYSQGSNRALDTRAQIEPLEQEPGLKMDSSARAQIEPLRKHIVNDEGNTCISKEIQAKPETFGNEDINEAIKYFESQINGSLDDTQKNNRRYAYLLIRKLKKDYPDSLPLDLVRHLIFLARKDLFHARNATNFKYLFYNCQKIIASFKAEKQKAEKIASKFVQL